MNCNWYNVFLAIVLADFEFRIMTKTITNLEVLGIFLWKLAADVESNMIKEISSETPPVFTSLDKTSSLGMICICT